MRPSPPNAPGGRATPRHRALGRIGSFGAALVLAGVLAGPPRELAARELIWPTAIAAIEQRLASEDAGARRAAAESLIELPRAVTRRLLPPLFADPDPEVRLAVAEAALRVRLRDAGERVVPWLSHGDARVRQAAADVLSVLPSERAIGALGRALSDPQADVRAKAALALGNSGMPEATLLLLGQLDDNDPEVRATVIRALEALGDRRAVVPLIGRMQERRVPLRREAALALGALGDARAERALIVTLGDADGSVRAAAAQSLGRLRSTESVWSLGAMLEEDADSNVQRALVTALGRIGTRAAAEVLVRAMVRHAELVPELSAAAARAGEEALPVLEECVSSPPTRSVGDGCVAALGAIGGERSRRLVESALRRASVSPAVGLEALGRIGDAAALPLVLESLSSSRPGERRAAIDALGQLLDPKASHGIAIEPLVLALEQARGARFERAALIALLGRTGSPRAAAELTPFARSSDEYLRGVALEALGSTPPAAEVDGVLLEAIESPRFPIRWTAAVALRRVGSAAAASVLLERLAELGGSDREALAFALFGPLGRSKDESLVLEAERALASSPGPVGDALLEAIAHVPGPSGREALLRALDRGGAATRAKVAEVLAFHPEALSHALTLARDPEPAVRANATWTLGHIGNTETLPLLESLTRDPTAAVAATAVAALAELTRRHPVETGATVCALLEDERSYVRANALAAIRIMGLGCAGEENPRWLLAHDPSDEVRLAAAALLARTAATDQKSREALVRCAERDPSGKVAVACSGETTAAPARPEETFAVSVLVVPSDAERPSARAPFALVRSDGLIRLGWADRRGSVLETAAPPGALRLALPAPLTDD